MPSYRRHVFVCLNERAPGHPRGCCKTRGGEDVRNRFKRDLAAQGLKPVVRANKAGCLDQCEHGVTVVVYPEQVWYGGVTPDDVPEIITKHILGGEYVTRLMIPDQPHLQGKTRGVPIDSGAVGTATGAQTAPSAAQMPQMQPQRSGTSDEAES